jgi:GH15 family glucan-1,4-alpha-glucosidase
MTTAAPRPHDEPQDAMPERRDGYLPIEDYAAIGDGRTLALVGRDGSIDWMCLPELDSPSVFGALLDPPRGGRFAVEPVDPYTVQRAYLERTNVLQTTFTTDTGSVTLTDAVTMDAGQVTPWRELVRSLKGVSGHVTLRWHLEPRFGYGERAGEFRRGANALVTIDGDLQLALLAWGIGDPEIRNGAAAGEFGLGEGDEAMLVLVAAGEHPLALPTRDSVARRLQDTCRVWRAWVSGHTYDGPWSSALERSLLALRLLADGRTGAIAAAGTTSLPEALGGRRNYDYRFAWVRDLSFTLDALMRIGMPELPYASLGWLLESVSHTHPRIDPVYQLTGKVLRAQHPIDLAGYRGTRPVNVGNQAGSQLQLGGIGDLMETVWLAVQHDAMLTPETAERLADIGDLACEIWRNRDAGLWELGSYEHYGTSKLGCWVAFDRLLSLVERGTVPARHVERWREERQAVQTYIERELWSDHRGSYLMCAGKEALDCGMLLAARRGFPDPDGRRLTGTIDAVRAELGAGDGLLYRYSGMQQEENAFLACSFWMVEALAVAGRVDEAVELMDGLVALGNGVGLYSEEMEPGTHAMRGNFPQALTHLALINAAVLVHERRSG